MTETKVIAKSRGLGQQFDIVENPSPEYLIQIGMLQGVENLPMLFEMRDKLIKEEQRKKYQEALANFQLDPPEYYKKGVNDFTKSTYARLEDIMPSVHSQLGKVGMAVSWRQKILENKDVAVCAIITHEGGHVEQGDWISAPPDTKGSKTTVQAVKTTSTILRRMTVEAALGLAAQGDDKDGSSEDNGSQATIDSSQIKSIKAVLKEIADKTFGARLLKHYKIGNIEDLPAKEYAVAIQQINAQAKKEKKAKKATDVPDTDEKKLIELDEQLGEHGQDVIDAACKKLGIKYPETLEGKLLLLGEIKKNGEK